MNAHIPLLFAEISIAKAIVPALIIGTAVALIFIAKAMTKRYMRIPPNVIGVIFGKKRKVTGAGGETMEVGFKLVNGGSVFVMPIFESYAEMSTQVFQIDIAENDVPSRKNVGVTVASVATCSVSPIGEEQVNAVKNFLNNEAEMKEMIGKILRGHLRSIVGGLEIEELLRERTKFNTMVINECSGELSRLGIKIHTFVINDVKDKEGYIEALGKQAVAVAKRDAVIATAEAERESNVKSSDAARTAAEAIATNDALIKEAEKNRDVQVAQFRLETATKQAEADMAGEIAKTMQQKKLVVLQAERDQADAEAQVKVQEMEAQRKKKELEATTIVTAEATARAGVITAEGQRNAQAVQAEARQKVAELDAQTARLSAEGKKNAAVLEGEGEGRKLQTIAEAQAVATTKTKTAEAEGERQKLLATADGIKATKLAEAEGVEKLLLAQAQGKLRALLAEAEGADKMAEAMTKLSEQGKLILVLDRLPHLLEVGGVAAEKVAIAIFANVAKSMEKMGPITITDLGGGGTAKEGIAAVGDMIPSLVAGFFAKAKLLGVDLSPFYKLLRMDPAELAKMVGPIAARASDTGAPVVPETKLTVDATGDNAGKRR